MRVVALVPARDEAATVGDTVRALRELLGVDAVLVIDDGSCDGTAGEASAAAARVLTLARSLGKGGAMQAGYEQVREEADVLLLLDADLGASAATAGVLLAPVVAGEADVVVGVLPRPRGSGGFGLVKGLSRWGIRRLGDRAFAANAPLSGQRALSRAAAAAVTPFSGGYGAETAMTVRALRAGLRVVEVPVEMSHAATGRDVAGFAHRGRQFAHVAAALWSLAFERRP